MAVCGTNHAEFIGVRPEFMVELQAGFQRAAYIIRFGESRQAGAG